MANGWRLDLIDPVNSVTIAVNKAWAEALQDLEKWMRSDLIDALVFGGLGIQGIVQTPFYLFISSPEGLSELGIEKTEPPKLLDAYKASFSIARNNRMLILRFGDTALLKMGTAHPASGTGRLTITSWMEWVLDGVNSDAGYVPRSRVPAGAQKHIRIHSAPGGLMMPRGVFGSSGFWKFPSTLLDYDRKWVSNNSSKIEDAIVHQMTIFLSKRLS